MLWKSVGFPVPQNGGTVLGIFPVGLVGISSFFGSCCMAIDNGSPQ